MLSETYSLDWIGVTGYLAYYEWCVLHRNNICYTNNTSWHRTSDSVLPFTPNNQKTLHKKCWVRGAGANWKFERARPLSSTRGRVQTSDRHFTRPAPSPAALALFSFHLFQILFAPFVNLRVPHRQLRITFSDLVLSRV